jgi:hypothetical protein
LPNDSAHCRAWAIRRRTSSAVAESEPDPLLGQLPDDVEGLVPLLGLEAVDREDELGDRSVVPPQGLGVLLPCGEHHLIMVDVPGEGVIRETDARVVAEFALDLGDRPVP